jgi:predicted transcriptional regulator
LLSIVEESQMKLSQVSSKMSSTVQETSRHLDRLVKARLIDKNAGGEFFLTSLGKTCLEQLSMLEFVSANRGYFLEHDLSFLPRKFLHRLGELVQSSSAKNVTDVIRHTERVIAEAKEYIFLMADQVLLPAASASDLLAKSTKNFELKLIIPPFSGPPPLQALPQNAEVRFIDHPKVAIAMNEERAGVAFPDLKGRLDMSSGFTGNNPAIIDWCHDFFLYSWSEAGKPQKENFVF